MEDTPSSSKELVLSYFASFDKRDPLFIAAHVAADFVNEQTAALGESTAGKSAYIERLPVFLEQMPDLHYEIEDLVTDGITTAVFYTMTGHFRGLRDFSIRGAQRLRADEHLIAHRTDYWDGETFLQQVAD